MINNNDIITVENLIDSLTIVKNYFEAVGISLVPQKPLNQCSLNEIISIIQAGKASEMWSIGDETAPVTLKGVISGHNISRVVTFFIIGFNHNLSLESPTLNHTVTFMMRDASTGNDIILCNGQFHVKRSEVEGWSSSSAKNIIMPQIVSCLPSDWQNALLTVNKYTYNGGGNLLYPI